MKVMANHIRSKIFKMNEDCGINVPKTIQSQAVEAKMHNRLMKEILKRGPNQQLKTTEQLQGSHVMLKESKSMAKTRQRNPSSVNINSFK